MRARSGDQLVPAGTLADAAMALRSGRTSSVTLARHAIGRADRFDSTFAVFADRYFRQALTAAVAADAAIREGRALGPLHGVPIGVKDLVAAREGPTRAGSPVCDERSAGGDATVVARLRRAGAVVLGKLSTAEFGIGLPEETGSGPAPRNPWNRDRWAGGSSSGSAMGVALGVVLGALGTDSGGSIRVPAAYCGVTGLMPTRGLVPTAGSIPLAPSLDRVGPMARSARDCALLLSVLAANGAGASMRSTAWDRPPLAGVRVGVDRLDQHGGLAGDRALSGTFDAAVAVLSALGATLVPVRLPLWQELAKAAQVVLRTEALAQHRERLGARWRDYGRSARLGLAVGALYTEDDQAQARRVMDLAASALDDLFARVDLVVTPTTAFGAPLLSEVTGRAAAAPALASGTHTAYWNGVANPVLALPIGFSSDGLPLGMQIAGRPGEDGLALRAGEAYQQATDWHLRRPPS